MNFSNYLNNIDYILELLEEYHQNPANIEKSWKYFFDGYSLTTDNQNYATANINIDNIYNEFKVLQLIDDYRKRGHLFTETNPVRKRRNYTPTLELKNYGLKEDLLNKPFKASEEIGLKNATLKKIIQHLKDTYCRSIGVEYMYIRNPEIVNWLKTRMETTRNSRIFSRDEKIKIFQKIAETFLFEQFLHKKFPGQKRFSVEGVDAILPALNVIAEYASQKGIKEIALGMAHRGRLTVLANFFEKPLHEIFTEYIGKEYDDNNILGDVKYHLGYERIKTFDSQSIKLILLPNPSHLETIDSILLGFAKARIKHFYNDDNKQYLPIIIHGDAALAGQGIVYETAQMSQLPGYSTGGTIHIVLNNQVGFTTNYIEGRSSTYCTDVAKILQVPIFHVNADDVESLIYVIELAIDFRQKYQKDVYIDILGYRKHGHNEGDEPRFTQPTLYKAISSHPSLKTIYYKQLINEDFSIEPILKQIEDTYQKRLEEEYEKAKQKPIVNVFHFLSDIWHNYTHADEKIIAQNIITGLKKEHILRYLTELNTLPTDKKFFPKAYKIIEERLKLLNNNQLDWALAEQLTFASLIAEGHPVRLSGQDSERGTFSHRHSHFVIEDTDERYYPLKNFSEAKASFDIYNSPLSEYGVLGFEYGYSLTTPHGLTIWEAQFGDFHNVGQVIIDQYISSAKDKWGLLSGITLFLPHGYEGQGPEHSSARIERFLVLAANTNMILAYPSNPANFFHLLRRQAKAHYRLPLIVFTPKSLLRHPLNISDIEEFSQDKFFTDIYDDLLTSKETIKQVIICSGKIYYELLDYRIKNNIEDTAIIRVEQLYPLNKTRLLNIIRSYPKSNRILWVQEEPANMGAWNYIRLNLPEINIIGVCRPPSGSTAPGLYELHLKQQQKIIEKAFKKCECQNIDEYCYMTCTENL